MPISLRAAAAALLWLAAAVPLVLYATHLGSPLAAVRLAGILGQGLRWVMLVGTVGFVALLLAYPPFLPHVRLWWRGLRQRMGGDLGPLREAQGRLKHLETAADHLVAGRAFLLQRRHAASLQHLRRAVELDGEHLASRYQLARALIEIGDLRGAIEQLATVIAKDESHAFGGALLELGITLARAGADAEAIAMLDRHTARFGPSRRAALHRAGALTHLGRGDEGVAALREAARPPEAGRSLSLEDQLYRARARVALWRRGRT
ncbi:MAG: tetratricopeptide repeat protein [Planctomycetota bacterium]